MEEFARTSKAQIDITAEEKTFQCEYIYTKKCFGDALHFVIENYSMDTERALTYLISESLIDNEQAGIIYLGRVKFKWEVIKEVNHFKGYEYYIQKGINSGFRGKIKNSRSTFCAETKSAVNKQIKEYLNRVSHYNKFSH